MSLPNDKFNQFRNAALAAGYRTIGARFDGSGDSGGINQFVLPHTLDNTSLAELSENFDNTFNDVSELYWDASVPGFDKRKEFTELLRLIEVHSIDIDEPFYNILENFSGDWVNNAGGYGIAWLDLQTGEYLIDGYQRYDHVDTAKSAGTLSEYVIPRPNPADNTTEYIKSLLS